MKAPIYECTYSRVIFRERCLVVQELKWQDPEIWATHIEIVIGSRTIELIDLAIDIAKQISFEKAARLYDVQNDFKSSP